MPDIGRDGLLKASGPLYGRPNRLSWEARRNARFVETGLLLTLSLIYVRTQRFINDPDFSHGLYVVSAVTSLVMALWARRRLLARAKWLETTERWWERLDELPHIIPFAGLQRRFEGISLKSVLRRRPAEPSRADA